MSQSLLMFFLPFENVKIIPDLHAVQKEMVGYSLPAPVLNYRLQMYFKQMMLPWLAVPF